MTKEASQVLGKNSMDKKLVNNCANNNTVNKLIIKTIWSAEFLFSLWLLKAGRKPSRKGRRIEESNMAGLESGENTRTSQAVSRNNFTAQCYSCFPQKKSHQFQ